MFREHLKQVPVFHSFEQREINGLSAICSERNFSKDALIIEQETPADGLYILLEGEIEVARQTASGAIVVLGQLRKGAVFGTVATAQSSLRRVQCVAKTDIKTAFLSVSDFRELMEGKSPLALHMQIAILRTIFEEIRSTNAILSELSALEPYEVVEHV